MDLSDTLQRIEEKLDRVAEAQARHAAILDEHQRRSLANEKIVELVRAEIDPLKKHVAAWAGAGKVLAIAGTVASVLGAVVAILKFLS